MSEISLELRRHLSLVPSLYSFYSMSLSGVLVRTLDFKSKGTWIETTSRRILFLLLFKTKKYEGENNNLAAKTF